MMTGMVGHFEHTVDAKGRLFLPAKQREKITSKVLYLTPGLDDCLFRFTEAQWDEFLGRLSTLPLTTARQAERFFVGNAFEAEIDGQGRISIPANLRKRAGIEKEVTVVGLRERLEFWDTGRWNKMDDGISSEQVEAVLSGLNF